MFSVPDRFTVNVDQESIDKGSCGNALKCAVSLAVNNHFGRDLNVETKPNESFDENDWTVEFMHTDDDKVRHLYRFSGDSDLSIWALAFDEGLKVTPIELLFECWVDYDDREDDGDYVNYEGDIKFLQEYNLNELADELGLL